MRDSDAFDLREFTPYLLNLAAEQSSLDFQPFYKNRYGMLRTEWRVLFHLGRYGPQTARDVCARARLHKTKVSRAVAALGAKRFLDRKENPEDRRQETLSLTRQGQSAFRELTQAARSFDEALMAQFTAEEGQVLRKCLERLAKL
ncbi:MAG: MarR family winged helix-turn-helix transcriptional regulator [Pseudomonadota bacterium]